VKTKEIVYLIAAVAIFGVVGYLIATQLVPQQTSSSKTTIVEVVGPIESSFESATLSTLKGVDNKDFYSRPDLATGLGNQAVFGQ